MTRMRVLKPNWRYGVPAKPYKQGDIVDIRPEHVKVIELSKIAEREGAAVAEPGKRKRGRPAGRVQKAGEKKTASSARKAPSKRRYQRRDMQAEK